MSEPPARGVVVAHGGMAEGLVDAVRKISGISDDGALSAVSNEGLGPDALLERLDDRAGEGPAIVFTDLQTGSCAVAARVVCRNPARRAVLFGVNLPMLLDFVFHRELPLDELVPRLLGKGRHSIQGFTQQTHNVDPPVSGR